ncbi:ankyrin repeat domain-containing protein [Amycolatopsis sp. NPDC021455]|uniref:ankyrin repeat domain-containing protein n=1 Tax=Amycolatopsis sp. NPDC021455 TaxID=3154901 RepID=UPI0033C5A7E5
MDSSAPESAGLADGVRKANALSEECPNCASRVVSPQPESAAGWVCADCGRSLTLSAERADAETALLALLDNEDLAVGDPVAALFRRGVTVRFLHSFSSQFDCWDWPTWRVVRDLVRPSTASTRNRYFDVVEGCHPEECGPPDVFVSHTWSARWGTVVGAAAYGCQDGNRRVWLDVFAVRQWPHGAADMNFHEVIGRCRSVLLAIDHDVVEESNLNDLEILTTRRDITIHTVMTESVRRKLPLARSWCLAEIVSAHAHGRPVIALIGRSITDSSEVTGRDLKLPRRGTEGSWHPERLFAISNFGLVERLSELVDVEQAETTLEKDKLRIDADIEGSLGYDRFNAVVRATLIGASLDAPVAECVLPFLCDGDDQQWRRRAPQFAGIDRAHLLGAFIGVGAASAVATLADEYGYRLEDRSMPALWMASGRGQLPITRTLVDDYHVSVEGCAGNGMTPLAAAAAAGNLDVVEFLLARGALIDKRARLGRTPLVNAAMWGHTRIVSVLGRAGADPDLVDAEGYSALAHAVFGRHVSAVRALISDCGANVNLAAGPAGFSALHWAARQGVTDIADVLITCGAAVDVRAEDGTTPLIIAVLSGSTEAAVLLVRAGAAVEATNDSGFGLLAAAVTCGDPSQCHVLAAAIPTVKYSVLKNQRFRGKHSALDMAILASEPAIVRALVEAYAWDLSGRADEGLPIVFVAVMAAASETAESLATLSAVMACGADPTARDGAGASVLFVCRSARVLAVLTGDPVTREGLAAIVNDRIVDGRSALHFAASADLAEFVRALVNDLGAEVDLPGPSGATPLVLAVRHDATAAVSMLVELGADSGIAAPDGTTLLQVAEEYAGEEMIRLIAGPSGH